MRQSLLQVFPGLETEVEIFKTRGDKILDQPLPSVGGKGLFTAELEAAILNGNIDFAVHSLKDLPVDVAEGLSIGAVPKRADPSDTMISREHLSLDRLPARAVVGTSSLRRASQIRRLRPDLVIQDIRGNVDTRVQKVRGDGASYDATLLARAGLERLDLLNLVDYVFEPGEIMPAPGQGALAVQCRDNEKSRSLLAELDDLSTRLEVTAERGFLAGLGGGCSLPISALCRVDGGQLHLRGRVTAEDGSAQIDVESKAQTKSTEAAWRLGHDLAREALDLGASKLLENGS
jgi:hydroxymethylbilane synthase